MFYYVIDFLSLTANKDIELYFVRKGSDENIPLSNVITFNTKNYDKTVSGEIGNLVFTLPFDNKGTIYQLCAKIDGRVNKVIQIENPWYQDWESALYTKIEIPVVNIATQDKALGLGIACSDDSNAFESGDEIISPIKLYYYD